MAYDIIIFDPDQVPSDDAGFRTWRDELFTREPGEPSPRISSLHDAALQVFPEDGSDERGVQPTKYFADHDHLEITFDDADAQAGSQWVQDYAAQNGFGVFDVDTTGQRTLPDPESQPPMPL